jgi:hypothetical protein
VDKYAPEQNIKSISLELPSGFLANPLATPRCTEAGLRTKACPAASQVGVVALMDSSSEGEWTVSGDETHVESVSPVYNLVPEANYPAELGFSFANEEVPVVLYASVVHTGTGYRVRVTSPGVATAVENIASSVTVFGEPGKYNGDSADSQAFLTSPAACFPEEVGVPNGDSAGGGASRLELTSWSEPERVVHGESLVYPGLSGCSALLFHPALALTPSQGAEEGSSVADEPSAYTVNLTVPQATGFSEPATPALRDATVALPVGVSVDPSSATGLGACQEVGPEGINIGSGDLGPGGQDLGDPEATELGRGDGSPGGNDSQYDDGFYHTAPGHCPRSSILGTVEVVTPLLASPLHGYIYLAQPKCGGEGQQPCTPQSALNGELFSGYIEVAGSGVIVKLPGTIEANPVTGQLTGKFRESPQFPFSDLKIHFKGGARAPVANPQACGSYATSSTLTSWAGQDTAGISPAFGITGCSATTPFNPAFLAETTSPVAGGFSPFVLGFSRQDREQDFSQLTVTMPPGLVGKIAGIPLCPEAEANAGTCGAQSQIGTASALAGPGPEPFSVTGGRVYLTGPYGGGPFGLSIVVPTKAGPFNLGDEVVRAAIHINPATAQVTVTTNQLPQSKDGVPFRLRSVNTEVNRPGFILNPTNCSAKSVAATITGSQGAVANVTTPFQARGCQNLPFKPVLTVSTKAKTSKADGASLNVDVEQAPGQANIAKVDLTIPKILPSRLTTIQKACLAATFEANPASCPEGSDIGTGTAHTPLLTGPLTGPAFLVSHGNAAFPDVEFVLQGEGVTIILDGKTDIKKGVTYSRFETVPDSPVTRFETVLPEGSHSALAANGNLCGQKLRMPIAFTAQNGAEIKQETQIAVTGCPTAISISSHKVSGKTTTLSVYVPAAGELTASGKGLVSASKPSKGQEDVTIAVSQKRAGKLKTKIKLTFTPSKGKKQSKNLTVRFTR